jgi:hypothetical protein
MNTLKHVGVLGMKWGIRKRGPSSSEHTRAREIKKKHISELSNDELKTVITRLSLEKQYKDINQASVGKGGRFVSQLLQNIGGQLINSYAKTKVEPAFVEILSSIRKNSKTS